MPSEIMLPVLLTLKSVVVALAVEEAIAKRVVPVEPAAACTESFAYGVVEPIPMLPEESIMRTINRARSTKS